MMTDHEARDYYWKLGAPYGFVPLLSPLVLVVGLPQVGLNLVTNVPWTKTITYHYTAFPLVAATLALSRRSDGCGGASDARGAAVSCSRRAACSVITTVTMGCVADRRPVPRLVAPHRRRPPRHRATRPRPDPRRRRRERHLQHRPAPQPAAPRSTRSRTRGCRGTSSATSESGARADRVGRSRRPAACSGRRGPRRCSTGSRRTDGSGWSSTPTTTCWRAASADVGRSRDDPRPRSARRRSAATPRSASAAAVLGRAHPQGGARWCATRRRRRSTVPPTARRATTTGPRRRSASERSVCAPPSRRTSRGAGATRRPAATVRARTRAWSMPRARRRAGAAGTQVTTSGRAPSAPRPRRRPSGHRASPARRGGRGTWPGPPPRGRRRRRRTGRPTSRPRAGAAPGGAGPRSAGRRRHRGSAGRPHPGHRAGSTRATRSSKRVGTAAPYRRPVTVTRWIAPESSSPSHPVGTVTGCPATTCSTTSTSSSATPSPPTSRRWSDPGRPGSGKTRVLTRRIAWRCATGRIEPDHVLAVTFTRKAAGELADRLRRSASSGRVDRRHHPRHRARAAAAPGRRPGPHPCPTCSSARSGSSLPLVGGRGPRGHRSPRWTSRARSSGPRPASSAPTATSPRPRPPGADASRRPSDVVADRRTSATRRRSAAGAWPTSTISSWWCGDALERDTEFAAAQRWRFRHLFVDEFQDISPAQLRLVRGWLGDRTDLCVVGDPDQAIYAFAGAESGFLSGFGAPSPAGGWCASHQLPLLTPRSWPRPRSLLADGGGRRPAGPGRLRVRARAHHHRVRRRRGRGRAASPARCATRTTGGTPWSEMAVLYRTNAQSAVFEEALGRADVPVPGARRGPVPRAPRGEARARRPPHRPHPVARARRSAITARPRS